MRLLQYWLSGMALAWVGCVKADPCTDGLKVSVQTNPPYSSMDAEGKPVGLDIEYLEAILQQAGCSPAHYIEQPWVLALSDLIIGERDLLLNSSRSAERESFAWFLGPYRSDELALFVRKGEVARYPLKRLDDIVQYQMRLGVVDGYIYGTEFTDVLQQPKVASFVLKGSNEWLNLQRLLRRR